MNVIMTRDINPADRTDDIDMGKPSMLESSAAETRGAQKEGVKEDGAMGSLAAQLDVFFDAMVERVDPATAGVIREAERRREEYFRTHRPIGEGDMAPDFTLPDQAGKAVSLEALRARGPVVLTFFRGGWCPFCSISLRAMNRVVADLRRAHATVVAVSPQTRHNTVETAERNGLEFQVLSDADNAVARRYGLVWTLGAEQRALFERLGHVIPRINGTSHWELPITAGYVIAPDGRVRVARLDARVTGRLEPADAVAAVRDLQAQPAE
jgi:peroxiredoxin